MVKEITADKKIRRQGNSLVVFVSMELKELGLDQGEIVQVTLSRPERD